MNSYREITETTFSDVAACAVRLGFFPGIASRGSNSYSNGQIDPGTEEVIRRILSGNAQFIVPVTWSENAAVGLNVEKSITLTEAVGLGWNRLLQAATLEMDFYRGISRSSIEGPDFSLIDSYIHSVLRGTTIGSNGFLRQGYLVVCKEGISLVGLRTDWTPPSRNNTSVRFTEIECMTWDRRLIPPSSAQLFFEEVTYIPYSEIQNIAQQDVMRLDGFAALVGKHIPNYSSKKIYKAIMNDTRGKSGPGRRTPLHSLIDLADEFPDEVVRNFEDMTADVIAYGMNPVSGTGLSDGTVARNLFSWGLAANIVDSRNGAGFVVESIFNELDTALALIADLSNPTGQPQTPAKSVSSEEPSQPHDLAAQLQKLSELRTSGALSDEEFTSAKKKLLGI
jgi:hypothetical protein